MVFLLAHCYFWSTIGQIGEIMIRRISILLLISLVSVSCSSNPIAEDSEPESVTETVATESSEEETPYTLDEVGLNVAATDCANEVLAVNDATDPDPAIQDAMISKVAECIVEKNPEFICSFGADPVCVWDSKAVKGPRVRLMDGVYNAFKAAGSPYFP